LFALNGLIIASEQLLLLLVLNLRSYCQCAWASVEFFIAFGVVMAVLAIFMDDSSA
jgi:hypothetical protein